MNINNYLPTASLSSFRQPQINKILISNIQSQPFWEGASLNNNYFLIRKTQNIYFQQENIAEEV